MKRKYTNDFLVDNEPMLEPDAGIELEENDLIAKDSGRDESGFLHEIFVRRGIKTWKFTYSILTKEEYVYIRSLFRGKERFGFTFVNVEGEKETVLAGFSQTSVSYWSARRGVYKDLQFEIYEL